MTEFSWKNLQQYIVNRKAWLRKELGPRLGVNDKSASERLQELEIIERGYESFGKQLEEAKQLAKQVRETVFETIWDEHEAVNKLVVAVQNL